MKHLFIFAVMLIVAGCDNDNPDSIDELKLTCSSVALGIAVAKAVIRDLEEQGVNATELCAKANNPNVSYAELANALYQPNQNSGKLTAVEVLNQHYK
jgi:UDP-3-O-[3-hydroxymyristoyl] glucosamine N-acyltransferase